MSVPASVLQVRKMGYAGEDFFEEEFLCKTKSECLRDYGKEDIRKEILRRMTQDEKFNEQGGRRELYMKIEDNRLTKKQLTDILMKQNKRILQNISQVDASGTGKYRASFPSKTTQPTMYDSRGRLKEEFLTEDHEDLTFFDSIENINYKVEVNPITRKASWKKVSDFDYGALIKGVRYKKDKQGRPDIRQLNYAEHHGKVVKDKNGKIHQVHCVKKNTKEPWEHPDNCKRDSNGKIKLQYGPYDPDMKKGSKVGQPEFVTPFGKYSYDELMKLPLDKILQMLIILELMDREGDYKTKMNELRARGVVLPGEEKYYERYYPAELAGRMAPGESNLMTRFKKMKSDVSGAEEELQEAAFRAAGLPACRPPRDERCLEEVGSYYPGLCVKPAPKGKQSKCFKRREKWVQSYNNSDYAKALGPATDWEPMTLKQAEEELKRRKESKRSRLTSSKSMYEAFIEPVLDLESKINMQQAKDEDAFRKAFQAFFSKQIGEINRLRNKAGQSPIASNDWQQVEAILLAQLNPELRVKSSIAGVKATGVAPGSKAGSASCPFHTTQALCVKQGCNWNAATNKCA